MSNQFDFTDEKAVTNYGFTTTFVAENYAEARKEYGKSKIAMDVALANAYKNGDIKETLAYDKALIKMTLKDAKISKMYKDMIDSEANYKGLERVLEARKSFTMLLMALMKNRKLTLEGNENE